MTSEMLAGRRLITLLFDISSMQPEDVQRAVDSATKYVDEKMTPADLVAVATVGSTLDVLTDFTADRAKVVGRARHARATPTAPRPTPPAAEHRGDRRAAAAADDDTTPTTPPSSTCSTTTSGCAR